jgi:hypothetical protein
MIGGICGAYGAGFFLDLMATKMSRLRRWGFSLGCMFHHFNVQTDGNILIVRGQDGQASSYGAKTEN